MVYMCHSFLIHSSADGHLGCFHVLAMINSALMNTASRFFMVNLQGFAGVVSFSWMLLIPLSVWHLLLTIQFKFKNYLYYGILLTIPLYYISCCFISQSCLTLCDPMIYSLPGSSVHGIFQARILEWVAISFSRESLPKDGTCLFCIGRQFLYHWVTREANYISRFSKFHEYRIDYIVWWSGSI